MKTAVIVLVLAAVSAGGWWLYPDSGGDVAGSVPAPMLYQVRRGPLKVTLTENGTLVAKESIKVSSGTDGRTEITYLIEEGALVEEGEVLCRLDTTEEVRDKEQLELDLVQAEANLKTARTELEIQQAENVSSVEKAVFALEKARQGLEKYEQGEGPNERRKLEVAVKQKETEYTRAKKRFEDSQLLFEQEFINKSQYEEDEIAYERAEVEHQGAIADLSIFEQYSHPMTLAEKRNAVADAELSLANAEKRAVSTLRQKEVGVEQAEKRLTKLNEQLADTIKEIEKMTVRSPAPGIVLYGDPEEPWQRGDIQVGNSVHGRTTIFTIPDLRVMIVKLWVHEADINKLHKGLPAKVTMDTYPGLVLDAEVGKIASIAGSPDRWDTDPEVKRFEVDVVITGDSAVDVKPGISSKAEIFVQEKADVISVPLQCVFLEEGEAFVYVMGPAGPERRAVTTGIGSDTHREIVAGLEVGERVLLYNPNLPGGSTRSPDDAPGAGEAGEAEEPGDGTAGEAAAAPGPGRE